MGRKRTLLRIRQERIWKLQISKRNSIWLQLSLSFCLSPAPFLSVSHYIIRLSLIELSLEQPTNSPLPKVPTNFDIFFLAPVCPFLRNWRQAGKSTIKYPIGDDLYLYCVYRIIHKSSSSSTPLQYISLNLIYPAISAYVSDSFCRSNVKYFYSVKCLHRNNRACLYSPIFFRIRNNLGSVSVEIPGFGDPQTLLSLNCATQDCSNPILRYFELKHLSTYLKILQIL